MRVYRVECDVNQFQSFYLDVDEEALLSLTAFDCSRKSDDWVPPPVFILHPKYRKGSFYAFEGGTFAVDGAAIKCIGDLMEMSGELLPLNYKDQLFYVMNVTECVDVLDEDRTEWVIGRTTGARIDIRTYAFHKRRFVESPLFKIPQLNGKGPIFTIEGMKDPEEEFKGRVEACGLLGLIFEEVWSDES